jgi:histidyl-tRNA synthetase
MQTKALPGFRDFYPADLALRSHILGTWRAVAARYGFEEYDGPPLEPLELYTAKSGDEIVGQLYNFIDKGGREIALRPEMTPTLARMVAARATGSRSRSAGSPCPSCSATSGSNGGGFESTSSSTAI